MPEKTKKKVVEPTKVAEPAKEKEIVFVCKFCGETKPLSDLIVMRQFYPLVSCCKTCAKTTRNSP